MEQNKLQAPGGPIEEKQNNDKMSLSVLAMDNKIRDMRNNMEQMIKEDGYIVVVQFCDGNLKNFSKILFSHLPQLETDRLTNYLICKFWDRTMNMMLKYSINAKHTDGEWYTDRYINLFIPMFVEDYEILLRFLENPTIDTANNLNNNCIRIKIFDDEFMNVVKKQL